MAFVLIVLVFCAQGVLGVDIHPTGIPSYSDSFLPAAAQIVYYVLDHTRYFNSHGQKTGIADAENEEFLRTATDGTEEGRGAKDALTPTQKLLLNLHTLLVKEAKLQGLAKYQGYSEKVMDVLRKTSEYPSDSQLRTVLTEALSNNNIRRNDTREAALKVLAQLNDPESDLRKMMENLESVQYT